MACDHGLSRRSMWVKAPISYEARAELESTKMMMMSISHEYVIRLPVVIYNTHYESSHGSVYVEIVWGTPGASPWGNPRAIIRHGVSHEYFIVHGVPHGTIKKSHGIHHGYNEYPLGYSMEIPMVRHTGSLMVYSDCMVYPMVYSMIYPMMHTMMG